MSSRSNAQRFVGGVLVAVVVFLGALLASYVSWPYGWDQGIIGAVGGEIVHGGLPYRDAWDMKGPVAFYVFALSHALFGPSAWGIRILDLMFLLAAAVVLFRVSRDRSDATIARFAVAAYVLWYMSGTFWDTAQPDAWASMLLLAAFAPLLTSAGNGRRSLIVAGVAVGAATLVKPVFAAFLAVPAMLMLGRSWKEAAGGVALIVVGWVLPLAGCALWFKAHGALDDLVEVHLVYPATVYAGLTSPDVLAIVRGFLSYLLPASVLLLLLPAAGAGAIALWRGERRACLLLVTWVIVGTGVVALQGRFFHYHWTLVHAPLIVLAAAGFHRCLSPGLDAEPGGAARPLMISAYATLILLRLAAHPAYELSNSLAYTAGLRSEDAYLDHYGPAAQDLRAARFLKERTREEDWVVMFGPNTTAVYLSGRRAPTRFVFGMPLSLGGESALRDTYRAEFMEDLRRRPPAYVVESNDWGSVVPNYQGVDEFPAFERYLKAHYALETTIGGLRIYRRL